MATPSSRDLTSYSRPILSYSHSDWPTNGTTLVYTPSNFRSDIDPLQPAQVRCQYKPNLTSAISRRKRIDPGTLHPNSFRGLNILCKYSSFFTFLVGDTLLFIQLILLD